MSKTNGEVEVCRDGWTWHYPKKPKNGSERLLFALRKEGLLVDDSISDTILMVGGHYFTRYPAANGKYGFAAGSPQYAFRQNCSGSLKEAVAYAKHHCK